MKADSMSWVAGAVVLVLCVVHPGPALAVAYNLSRTLDDSGVFSSFEAPVVNAGGTMAFTAQLDSGVRGIYTVTPGGVVTTIADSSGAFNRFFSPTINSSGKVAFYANLDAGGKGIYLWDGASLATIADDGAGPFLGDDFGLAPWVNDSGTVAFGHDPLGGSIQAIYIRQAGGPLTKILDTSGDFSMFSNPSINSAGKVAVWARLDDSVGAERGIYVASAGSPVQKIRGTDTFWSFFSGAGGYYPINAADCVAFYGSLDVTPALLAIYVSDGGPLRTAVDTGEEFSQLLTYSMNNSGTVAFYGRLDAGGEGIFTGPDPSADKVIAVGDVLMGTTVSFLMVSSQAINDSGQVVFAYSGSGGIVVGTPVPEPATLALVGVGALGSFGCIRRRRAKQQTAA